MTDKKEKFVTMIDEAIAVAKAEAERQPLKQEMYTLATVNLGKIRENFLNGKLGPSGGASLGLSFNIGEFDSAKLYDLGWKIDKFYKEELAQ